LAAKEKTKNFCRIQKSIKNIKLSGFTYVITSCGRSRGAGRRINLRHTGTLATVVLEGGVGSAGEGFDSLADSLFPEINLASLREELHHHHQN
jgi:hypothetical protein